MEIRKGNLTDLGRILEIYAYAKDFMVKTGNPTQWGDDYPQKELLEEDIEKEQLYVMEESGQIHGVFVFIIGEEPTYQVIEDGAWPDDSPYGTIHRIAGDGQVKGILQSCVNFCKRQIDTLRIDTHHDNLVMQGAIKKSGFQRCGIIHFLDGSARIAYQSC